MPSRVQNSSFRNSPEYIHIVKETINNAIAAGKPLRPETDLGKIARQISYVSKPECKRGAEQLATVLKNIHGL